jgi:hypothetical protein
LILTLDREPINPETEVDKIVERLPKGFLPGIYFCQPYLPARQIITANIMTINNPDHLTMDHHLIKSSVSRRGDCNEYNNPHRGVMGPSVLIISSLMDPQRKCRTIWCYGVLIRLLGQY